MANVYLREYQGLANTQLADSVPIVSEDGATVDQVVAAPTTAVASAPFNSKTKYVVISGDAVFSYVVSPTSAPVAAAVTNLRVPANTLVIIRVPDVPVLVNGKALATWQISVIPNT